MNEISELLHKLRALQEPSREIDTKIWRIFEGMLRAETILLSPIVQLWMRAEISGIPDETKTPEFTNDMIAAARLVPQPCWWVVGDNGDAGAGLVRGECALVTIHGAGNPAIALAIVGIGIRVALQSADDILGAPHLPK